MEGPARDRAESPRNWLDRAERRDLYLTWMPAALVLLLLAGWAERALWGPAAAPAVRQVDTRLAGGPLVRTVDDAVTIEGPADPVVIDEARDDADLAAAPELLAAVRDDTVFRSADGPAWFAIWGRLAAEEASGGPGPRGRKVSFSQLFEQPRSFRGRRVRFAGRVRRLQEVEAPSNDLGIEHTWQAWVEPAGGPPSPIVVYFLSVPSGMPTGLRVDEPVIVDGVFFKRWAYQASDAIRLAPLVMARTPIRPPRIERGRGESAIVGWALFSIAVLVAVTAVALAMASRSRPGRPRPRGPLFEDAVERRAVTEEETP